MLGHFEPVPGGGAAITLDDAQISILRSLAVQLLELIGPGDAEPQDATDPFAALFAEGPSEPPSDPALARLFPDAYGGPDRELGPAEAAEARAASAEFRRYTENDLRARKREDALVVVRSLDSAAAGISDLSGASRADADTDAGTDAGTDADAEITVLELDAEDSGRWLGTLNDLRLAIGTRLEVTDEEDGGQLLRLPDSDPRKPMVVAYFWLGELQESLVETLMT